MHPSRYLKMHRKCPLRTHIRTSAGFFRREARSDPHSRTGAADNMPDISGAAGLQSVDHHRTTVLSVKVPYLVKTCE